MIRLPGKPGSALEPIHLPNQVWRDNEAVLRARDVGGLFRLAKRYAGASQHRIATATGVPQSRVNALMNNRCGPVTSIDVLQRIADGLHLPDHARATLGLAPSQDIAASGPVQDGQFVHGRDEARCALGRPAHPPAKSPPGEASETQYPDVPSKIRASVGSGPAADAGSEVGVDGGETTDRRQALLALGGGLAGVAFSRPGRASAVEAMEYTRRAEATEVGARTVEHLQLAITEMASAFAHTPPAELFGQALWYRRHVAGLLEESRHTLRERRELYRCAGWLSVILGWLSNDLGSPRTGEAYCLDAWEHGWQAEYGEVCAWAMDAAASIAMYSNRPGAARQAAVRGLGQAPASSAAAVRVSCQLARASARLGHQDEFHRTLRDTQRSLDDLPEHDSGLFGADTGRIASYAATSAIWLGNPEQAVGHAQDAISFYEQTPTSERSPTREAIARLDLGIALSTLGQLDAAVEAAEPALSTQRLTGSVLARAGDLDATLQDRFAGSSPTRHFRARYRALTAQRVHGELIGP